jgi:hypothetical protein
MEVPGDARLSSGSDRLLAHAPLIAAHSGWRSQEAPPRDAPPRDAPPRDAPPREDAPFRAWPSSRRTPAPSPSV